MFNPFDLTASDLLIWGIVAHLIADWPLQNDWMARGKRWPWQPSVAGLAPVVVHAWVHGVAALFVFGFWPAVVLGVTHMLIDTGKPVLWWSRLIRQTQPAEAPHFLAYYPHSKTHEIVHANDALDGAPMLVDIGTEVRFWTDQVFHIACIAIAALVVA